MRRLLTWCALLALVSSVLAFVPGFDVLSFYFCLPIALIVGMACGGVAVTLVDEARTAGLTVRTGWARAFGAAGLLVAVPLAVSLVNGLRVVPCDLGYGLLFYGVGPVVSGLVGVVLGAVTASLVPRGKLAHLLFCLLFLATFVADGLHLYREPAVFFFNPFLGYYPGPIYDDFIEVTEAYLWFRLLCVAGAAALVSLAWALVGADFRIRVNRRPWPWAALGLSLGTAITLMGLAGELGFRVDRGDVESVLKGKAGDGFCEIRYDPAIPAADVKRLLSDCGFRHRQAADFFDLEPGDPIKVYLYADPDSKARLMGARYVEVTKPWLGEIHLTVVTPGDMVLGHEIAHVVAGRLADSFLGVPTRHLAVPDMALVEGLAVACAFADNGPSPHEWSLAMVRAGVATDPAQLFGPSSFVTAHAGRAYTTAGSFIRFISDHFGTGAIRDLAAGKGLKEATGSSLADLSRQWLQTLESEVGPGVDRDLVNQASGRFSGPGVLGRRCPVDVARLLEKAWQARLDLDLETVRSCLEKAHQYDPSDPGLKRELARLAGRIGDPVGVRQALDAMTGLGDAGSRPVILDLLAAADALVFLAFQQGESAPDEARAYLQSAAGLAGSGPRARGLRARLWSLDLPPGATIRVLEVLAGREERPAGALFEALSLGPGSSLIHYLLGRALVGEGDYEGAVEHLGAALALGLPDPLFVAEAEKTLGKAAWWYGDGALARRHLLRALDTVPYEGDRMVIEEYLARLGGG